jgi:hypothetical protein
MSCLDQVLSTRVAALLNTQAVFVAAIAFLYNSTDGTQIWLLKGIAALGLATTLISGIGILCGCRVIRQWLLYGESLKKEDEAAGVKKLEGHYLKGRVQPDWLHWWSIDFFGMGLSVSFVLFWIVVLGVPLIWK